MYTVPPRTPEHACDAPGAVCYPECPPLTVAVRLPSSGSRGTTAAAPRPLNVLAIVALIIAFPLGLVGIILGAVSLRQMRTSGESGRGLAIGGIVVGAITTLLVILAGTLMAIALVASGAAARDARSDSAASSPADDPTVQVDIRGTSAEPDPGTTAVDDYLAAVVPEITTVFREIDPLLDADEITAIWTESMLVEFGEELLADPTGSTKGVFVDEVVASSDGLLSHDQASRLYQAIFDAARAHLD